MPESAGIADPKTAAGLILVPNQRIRDRCLARRFRAAGAAAVQVAPPVEVFSQWVVQTAARLDLLAGAASPASAGPLALQMAWFDAIGRSGGPPGAARRRLLARRARAAERDLRHWFPEPDSAWLDAGFRQWRGRVAGALREQGLAAPEDWLERLTGLLESGRADPRPLPPALRLHGFVELTALEQRLLAALRQRGIAVEIDRAEPHPEVTGSARMFDDPQAEARAAAVWAREQLAQGRRHIGIVVNGLDGLAAELQASFDRVLRPEAEQAAVCEGASPYHLPGGGRLSGQALIADALLLLRLSLRGPAWPLPFPRFSRLLLSPFLAASDTERHARALLELRLRAAGQYRRSLRELSSHLQQGKRAARLPVLAGLLRGPPGATAVPDPARAFRDCLQAWGWPGPFARGRQAEACLRRFADLLEDLRVTGLTAGPEALDWLAEGCGEAPLTERGGPLSPVQLLAPEDAAGERFEAAWVMNVHAGNWPGRVPANPFLPAAAGEHVPRASAAGELDYTRRLQAYMAALAPAVTFSWARQGGAAPRLPSPLVLACCAADPGAGAAEPATGPWPGDDGADKPITDYTTHPWLEAIEDRPGLPLAAAPAAHIPGGAALLRDQSACPLAAYLTHRLAARFDPMPGPFADASCRGQLLHAALEELYRDQAGRPGLPAAAGIAAAVGRALQRRAATRRLGAAGFAAERERLCLVLRDWLEFEQCRAGFTLEGVEWRHEFDYRGFTLAARMDRVDRLRDGRLLIIDYKSSRVDANDWSQLRPAQPQLPLYAVLLERSGERVGGLALAAVRPGECALSGVVDDPEAACGKLYAAGSDRHGLAGRFADWAAIQAHFEHGIYGLLDEIIAGQAENVAHQPRVVAWSGLEPVLRHAEGAAWLAAHGARLPGGEDD